MSGNTINANKNVYNVANLFCLMIEHLYNLYVIICDRIYYLSESNTSSTEHWKLDLFVERSCFVQTKNGIYICDFNLKCGLFQKCLH